jgi:hypothetical protein
MSKKELRKQLEILLVKAIQEVLIKSDAETAKKVRKITYESSKNIAKKFYKSLKTEVKISVKPAKKRSSIKKSKPVVKKATAKNKK